MEDFVKKSMQREGVDKDIVFSKSIKAGKRIYYLDVKKNRNDEMYLAITESKKVFSGEGDNVQMNFEKHKIFLYREDFEKFAGGLAEVIGYIVEQQGTCPSRLENSYETYKNESFEYSSIKIDIDF